MKKRLIAKGITTRIESKIKNKENRNLTAGYWQKRFQTPEAEARKTSYSSP